MMGISGLLAAVVLAPCAGALLLAFFDDSQERAITRISVVASGLSSAAAAFAIIWALSSGYFGFSAGRYETPGLTFFSRDDYRFTLSLLLDFTSAVFLLLVQFTCGIVIRLSRMYMHREPGIRGFFAIVLLFQSGMALLALGKNLDVIFAGWEIAGIASFLLIAFYHMRRAPVRNALKTYSIYRFADVGMLLGVYLEHATGRAAVGILLLLAAAGKSAQVPFSFWIVRAMEGPTPSSALFYGALSVHAGAYLLLRTYALWSGVSAVHFSMAALGLVTAVLCTMFSRVQHTIKGRIGYASVAQVGLIFIEIALGFKMLALFHIVCNALVRGYQILVSPSAVVYLLREQNSSATKTPAQAGLGWRAFPSRFVCVKRVQASLFVFSVSEGYLEAGMRSLFWNPLKTVANLLFRLKSQDIVLGSVGAACAVSVALLLSPDLAKAGLGAAFVFTCAAFFSVAALNSRRTPLVSLSWIGASALTAAMSVIFAPGSSSNFWRLADYVVFHYVPYVGFAFLVAIGCTARVLSGRGRCRRVSTFALLGILGMIGFPGFPVFFGEGLLLEESFRIHSAFAIALSGLFALNGYLAICAFAFAFYGRTAISLIE